jgi:hypothetical protein
MSERIRSSFQFILNKLGCNRKQQQNEKRSLRRVRLNQFDDTVSLNASDGEECGSDCTSCENQRLLDELHGVKPGDEKHLDAVVDQIMDKSLLTPSKLPIIEAKRTK